MSRRRSRCRTDRSSAGPTKVPISEDDGSVRRRRRREEEADATALTKCSADVCTAVTRCNNTAMRRELCAVGATATDSDERTNFRGRHAAHKTALSSPPLCKWRASEIETEIGPTLQGRDTAEKSCEEGERERERERNEMTLASSSSFSS